MVVLLLEMLLAANEQYYWHIAVVELQTAITAAAHLVV
jgi:hypothetical protein